MKMLRYCLASLFLALAGLTPSARAAEQILFSDDFSSPALDPAKWDTQITNPAQSSLAIVSGRLKVTFWGGSGTPAYCYAIAKNISLPADWTHIHLRGNWSYESGATGEGSMSVFDALNSSLYMYLGCAAWQGPLLSHSDSCGNADSTSAYSFPEKETSFEWTLSKTEWQYAENGSPLFSETCDSLASSSEIRFKIGGWDMSPNQNIYYFDNIQLAVEVNPQGDTIANPFPIDSIPFTESGNTCSFTDDYDGSCGDANSGTDVVYSYTPAADITVDAVLADSHYDTRLYVFQDSASNCIACANDNINGNKSILYNVAMTVGHTYYIVVDGDNSACGEYALYLFKSRDPAATTWYVKTDGNDYNNGQSWDTALQHIQTAIDKTSTGHTVLVADGTYTGPKNRSLVWGGEGQVKHITVKSANGPEACIIDCQNAGRGFDFFNRFLNSSDRIEGFTITNGQALAMPTLGGGISISYNSSPVIENCILRNNVNGSIYIDFTSNPVIRNCIITDNAGPGMYIRWHISPAIENCIIANNTDSGILCDIHASPSIKNCLIYGNQAASGAGIYCFSNSSPSIRNCTIAGNSATHGGGIYCHSFCNFQMINSIVWNNTGSQIYLLRYDVPSTPTISYSNIQGGPAGVVADTNCYVNWGYGCLDQDPYFVDPNNGNFHLKSEGWRYNEDTGSWTWDPLTSRCIDAGSPGSSLASELLAAPRDPAKTYGDNVRVNMGYYGSTDKASLAPPHHILLADINNDGACNLIDFTLLAKSWNQTQPELPPDFDRSGAVNLNDLTALAQKWLLTTAWH